MIADFSGWTSPKPGGPSNRRGIKDTEFEHLLDTCPTNLSMSNDP